MPCRANINFDFSKTNKGNAPTQLKVALIQAGWSKGETTAYFIVSNNLHDVWKGIELVAKQCAAIGVLSALTFHVQLDALHHVPKDQMDNFPNALPDIEGKPWP